MSMMKRTASVFLVLISISSMIFAAGNEGAPSGSSTSGGSALPEWIWRDFDQRVVNVSFIVNDILYAGFSKKAVTQFLPVQEATRLSADEPINEEDADSYHSTMFFIYCLASTKMGVKLSLDFGDAYKGKNPNDNIGIMVSNTTESIPEQDKQIPVSLEGVGKTLPYVLPVLEPGRSEVQTVAVSNSAQDALRLTVYKNDIPAKASGTYRTELVLTAEII